MAAVKTKIPDPATSVQPKIMAVALNEEKMLDKAGIKPEKG